MALHHRFTYVAFSGTAFCGDLRFDFVLSRDARIARDAPAARNDPDGDDQGQAGWSPEESDV